MKKYLLSFFTAAGLTAVVFSATGNSHFKNMVLPLTDTTPVIQGHQADTANNGYIGTPGGTKTSGLGNSSLGLPDTTSGMADSMYNKKGMKMHHKKGGMKDSTSTTF